MLKFKTKGFLQKDFDDWDKFVNNHPLNNIYQSAEMYQFYSSVKNYTPFGIICRDFKNNIVGVLLIAIIKEYRGIGGWLSSRAIMYGTPIVKEDCKKNLYEDLLKLVIENLRRKAAYIQVRNSVKPSTKICDSFIKCGFKIIPWDNINVRATSHEDALANLSSSRKRQVTAKVKHDFEINNPTGINEVLDLYLLLKKLYKDRINKPLPDKSFFVNFYLQSQNNRIGIIRVARINNKIVGGFIAPITNGDSLHEWYITGLDRQYKEYQISTRLTWYLIEYSIENKLSRFDFGGAGSSNVNSGVKKFKQSFCPQIDQTNRFEIEFFPAIRRVQEFVLTFRGRMRSRKMLKG